MIKEALTNSVFPYNTSTKNYAGINVGDSYTFYKTLYGTDSDAQTIKFSITIKRLL
jgi:hypothetical protein